MKIIRALLLLALALALALASYAVSADASVSLVQIVSGLTQPVAITHAGDGRLFITQQNGLVSVYDGTALRSEPFLDIRHLVTSGGERGLLSIAFHPRHSENRLFFVNYTDASGATVVARYSTTADPNRADPGSARQILRIPQPFANHNGGQMQFGPDGFLYIGTGDGGSGGDPGNRAQNLGDLLGKMLRIDVDHGDPYAIPPSNPFVASPAARPEVWSLGLRNPWRFSFDRASGDLWIADVGQGSWEEVNFQPATSMGGENYGWRKMEATHCFSPATNCNDGTLVLPVIEYGHSGGACSVTGGYTYRGSRFPRLHGLYIYGDYCSGQIWGAFRQGDGRVVLMELLRTGFRISSFGEGFDGELYVADHGGGRVYRIEDRASLPPKRRAAGIR